MAGPRSTALAVASPGLSPPEAQTERFVQYASGVLFPQLIKQLSQHGLGGPQLHVAATRILLQEVVCRLAHARGQDGLGQRLFPPDDDLPRLSADWMQRWSTLFIGHDGGERFDFRTLPPRCLGELYQRLASADRPGRKARGMFYTPLPLVEFIVRETLGPRLSCRDNSQPLRILDPAMGTGHFLLAAADYLAPQDAVRAAFYGVDLDPTAVQLARAALALQTSRGVDELGHRLCCGDALSDESIFALGERNGDAATADSGMFDCILGNPPYGSHIPPALRRQLIKRLPQMRHNGDTAVGFLELCCRLLAPGGRCGLVVPKALTYSYAWRHMREMLARRLEQVVDLSRAWPDVRLEQVIVIFRDSPQPRAYSTRRFHAGAFTAPRRLGRQWAERFGTLPCSLDDDEIRRVQSLRLAAECVGDVVKTRRGLPLQSQLRSEGATPVVGGRDLARWRLRSTSGYLPPHACCDMGPFAAEKLVFQNIIAHISRPRPRILLIGAYDHRGTVTLDTVNNLYPRGELPLRGLLAFLHSRLVNWFVYSVIYNKAVRTMHFDQYFLNKIPLPENYPALLLELAELAVAAENNARALAELEQRVASESDEEIGQSLSSRQVCSLLANPIQAQKHAARWGVSARVRALLEQRAAEWHRLHDLQRRVERRIDEAVNAAYGADFAE